MAKKETRTVLPFTAKACIFLAGFSNFLLGYALYFCMYDTDREKAEYFRIGARWSIIVGMLAFAFAFVLALFQVI